MKKLWSKDINFLSKNANENQNYNEILHILNKIESTKIESRDYYFLDLTETETDLVEDFLTDLICKIGIDEDGEVNQTGKYIDDLIDVFNTRT